LFRLSQDVYDSIGEEPTSTEEGKSQEQTEEQAAMN